MIELSIIVPILNEAETLPALFAMLSWQERVAFELILADGGSTDGTAALAEGLAATSTFACRLLHCEKGRGRQLNAGARAAVAGTLLFLHADSAFPDAQALRRGLDTLAAVIARRGDCRAAGRFALRFDVPPDRYGFGYYYYECKARLGRPEGIHGDQGFLLPRTFFDSLGSFDETLALLEDNRFAEAVRREGEWLLIPAEVVTSARRFEAEGLYERQILNALIMNFGAIGWDDFFRAASGIYRQQDITGRLRLLPFFRLIRDLLRQLPVHRRLGLWYRTGVYVRPNAWQLAFALDVRRNFRRGVPAGGGRTPLLDWFDRWYEPLTDHPPGRLAAAGLVWLWFQLTMLRLRVLNEGPQVGECPLN
ncbi:MAG TPA: TIGR04283 family arsenosugar biosynthesis glycosyltransferase [Desulfuromonadales bacterium]